MQAFPATPEANHLVRLEFTPKVKDSDELVSLDVHHEKKIHVIIVNESLSFFDHVHPEMASDNKYAIDYTFPGGGKYFIYTDYQPSGSTPLNERIELDVSGKELTKVNFSDPKLTATSGNYSITLQTSSGKFLSGGESHITGILKHKNKEIDVNSLENYLGAKAHIVMINAETKKYVHVHPDVEKGRFDIHVNFEEPGLFRAWVQFMSEGQLYTTDFVIRVEEGVNEDHEHPVAEHDHKH
jgi:hypothetical protein